MNILNFLKKRTSLGVVLFVILITLYVIFSPRIFYNLGNIFFGGVPKLYNLNFAQVAFYRAAHPLFGKPYPYASHQLSRTYFIKGKLDTSLSIAYQELRDYPKHRATYYIIGLTLGYMNKEKEAIDAFSKYIDYNPKTWAARNDKAWLQFRIGDIDGAIDTLEPIVDKQLYNVWVQNTYCALMLQKKEYIKARNACLQAQSVLSTMTEEAWGKAYPGNDPRIYKTGLQAMKLSVASNLKLLEGK